MTEEPPESFGFDVTETMAAFREPATLARESYRTTEVTYALARPIVFPGPDGAYVTREVRLRVGGGGVTRVTIGAHAARVNVHDPGDGTDRLEVVGDTEWMMLPDEVAALFAPPTEGDLI